MPTLLYNLSKFKYLVPNAIAAVLVFYLTFYLSINKFL